MIPVPIQVECYSGYKADERPIRFVFEGLAVEIAEVRDQWLAAGRDPGQPPSDYFKVLCRDGREYLLRHDLETDAWFLANRW